MRKTTVVAKSTKQAPKFYQSLPPFSGIPTLAHELTQAVTTVIDDVHNEIVEDFMPIYSAKQRENINVAFERLKKELKKTIGLDVKTLVANVQVELQKVRV